MNRLKHIVSCLIILFAITSDAQSDLDIKVKKTSSAEFYYKGKPVAPQALERMFPLLGDGGSADTVNLRLNPFMSNSYRDTSWTFSWESAYQKQRAYRSDLGSDYYRTNYQLDSTRASYFALGFTNYIVLGMTTGGKFIVLSILNGGGSLTQCCVFILDIRGDTLVRLGYTEIENIRDYPIEIKGNTISCGKVKYEIPKSAR